MSKEKSSSREKKKEKSVTVNKKVSSYQSGKETVSATLNPKQK
ncbi:hypothetical protein [Mucilaginibacter terrenus]|nr:hypothetical protein [Mucilaginibacter terrenus]